MDYAFKDFIDLYKTLNSSEWVTVFEENPTQNYENDVFTFCAMFRGTSEELEEYLATYNWGFSRDSFGKSTFVQYENSDVEYSSGEQSENFEYLIAIREFDKHSSVYEINPKLVWYGNLYHVGEEYKHPKTDEVMITAEKHRVQIRTSYLKDFLSANKSYLSVVFDHRRYFREDEIKDENTDTYAGNYYHANWMINKTDSLSELSKTYNYCSSIIGKAIITPYAKPQHEDYRYFFCDEQYEKFVIHIDENGNKIECECDPKKLGGIFEKSSKITKFVTPVYFNIKVLDKYRIDPENYEIQDSQISYLRDWSIQFCINDERKVVVWLGDLGMLPHEEQKYWKSFNESPKGKIEEKFFIRQILGHWTDESRLESQFISSLQIANDYTLKKYNDVIFKRLSEADAEIYRCFMLPTNSSYSEYNQFLMKLCKLTTESLNTKLFKSVMGDKYNTNNHTNKGSLCQLDDFMKYTDLDSAGIMYSSIKKAYDSRNKLAGHRGSMEEYNKVWKRKKNYEVNLVEDAKELLNDITTAIYEVFGKVKVTEKI